MKGVALIPALLGTVILGIIIVAITSVTTHFSRDTQSLAQKLEIIQIQQTLFGALDTGAVCGCNMDSTKNTGNTTPLRFDSTNLATARINFDRIFGSCNGINPANPILTKDQAPSGNLSGVMVREISLGNIQTTGTPGLFYGELTVNFESASLIMGRKPAVVGVNFRADLTSPSQARITSCSTGDPNAATGMLPAGTPGAPCGPANSGITFLRMQAGGGFQRVCCTIGSHYQNPTAPQFNGDALNCPPYVLRAGP